MPTDDHSLLRRFVADGSRESLEELVRRYVDMVYAAALRDLADPHGASDVTQAVFLLLMRRAGHISAQSHLAGWLFKTTRFVAADVRKMAARRTRHERQAAAMQSSTSTIDQLDTTTNDLSPLLNDAMSALPAKYRDIVVLVYLQGKSHREVAEAQQLTENAIRQRLFRALEKLRRHFVRRGVAIGDDALGGMLASIALPAAPLGFASRIVSFISSPAAGAPALIADHAIRSRTMFRIKATVSAIAIVVLVGLMVQFAIAQVKSDAVRDGTSKDVAATPTANEVPVATTAPVTQALADAEMSPQDVLAAAMRSAVAGNVERHLSYFAPMSPAEQEQQRRIVALLVAVHELGNAVAAKFGDAVRQQFDARVGLDLSEAQLKTGRAIIEGDTAMVDLAGAGPGVVPMVKTGAGWKISPTVIAKFNAAMLDKLPTAKLHQMSLDIAEGKYADPQAFGAEMRKLVSQ